MVDARDKLITHQDTIIRTLPWMLLKKLEPTLRGYLVTNCANTGASVMSASTNG